MRAAPCTCVVFLLTLAACGDDDAPADPDAAVVMDAGPPVIVLPDEREACAERNELKNPYFGDLHVHSAVSFDAAGRGIRTRPADAYRFARGQPIDLPPYDASGAATRTLQLARPLDFAAVTDHAELFAETAICTDPTAPGYDSRVCTSFRDSDPESGAYGALTDVFLFAPPRRPPLCVMEPETCAMTLGAAWQEVQDAAEDAYDRTSTCSFTTFVAWEWTGSTGGNNFHRNVIFRNRSVPRVPTSYVEAPTAPELWDAMDSWCLETGTPCDVLIIPHNSNLAAGNMFVPENADGAPYDQATAERRVAMEPLVEVYQHKGNSECLSGPPDPLASEDELCAFEQLHNPICTGSPSDPMDCIGLCSEGGGIGFLGGCVEPRDYVRTALRIGLAEQARIGANPFRLGFIGSTDTHNNAPGSAEEDNFAGHQGTADSEPEVRVRSGVAVLTRGVTTSPGGLAVIWAEQNDRDALFDALRARETYATSGTRIVARFFGGWRYPDTLCADPELVRMGYEGGVPMGGELGAPPAGAAPVFVVSAMRDAMGAALQRVQIIKGWVEGGETREQVFEVAGDPLNGATVDTATCTPMGAGADSLCGVWTDPSFDPAVPAFWYARVVENPVCRWHRHLCNANAVDCTGIAPDDPWIACCDPDLPDTIQERAWTSPIWYTP